MSKRQEKILVVSHDSPQGAAIARLLPAQPETAEVLTLAGHQLDLRNQSATRDFLRRERPTQIYMSVGSLTNAVASSPAQSADRLLGDLMAATNLIGEAHRAGVKKLLLIGSSCVYPAQAPCPLAEEDLMCGRSNPQDEPQAIATIAALKLCQSHNWAFGPQDGTSYRCLLSPSVFGPAASDAPVSESLIPTLIRLIYQAKVEQVKSVNLPLASEGRAEWLYADDLAAAALHVMRLGPADYTAATQTPLSCLNAGYGPDTSNQALAHSLAGIIGYRGKLNFSASSGAPAPSRQLDSFRLTSLGWRPQLEIEDALSLTYLDFLAQERRKAGESVW